MNTVGICEKDRKVRHPRMLVLHQFVVLAWIWKYQVGITIDSCNVIEHGTVYQTIGMQCRGRLITWNCSESERNQQMPVFPTQSDGRSL